MRIFRLYIGQGGLFHHHQPPLLGCCRCKQQPVHKKSAFFARRCRGPPVAGVFLLENPAANVLKHKQSRAEIFTRTNTIIHTEEAREKTSHGETDETFGEKAFFVCLFGCLIFESSYQATGDESISFTGAASCFILRAAGYWDDWDHQRAIQRFLVHWKLRNLGPHQQDRHNNNPKEEFFHVCEKWWRCDWPFLWGVPFPTFPVVTFTCYWLIRKSSHLSRGWVGGGWVDSLLGNILVDLGG